MNILDKLYRKASYLRFKSMLTIARSYLLRHLDWEDINVYFIVSTGRTGTTFLANLFDELHEVNARHEPKPDFFKLGNDFARQIVSFDKAKKRIITDRKLVLWDFNKTKVMKYVESNNRLYSLIPVLREAFENPKFIHIVRDGRDIVRSGVSRGWYTSDDSYYRIQASWFENDPYSNKWEELTQFEKVCWWWQKKDNYIYRETQNKEDSILLKFEDVFNPELYKRGLGEMVDFLELNKTSRKRLYQRFPNAVKENINATSYYTIPHWTEWDVGMKESFMEIAGEHMSKYNYFIDEEW